MLLCCFILAVHRREALCHLPKESFVPTYNIMIKEGNLTESGDTAGSEGGE